MKRELKLIHTLDKELARMEQKVSSLSKILPGDEVRSQFVAIQTRQSELKKHLLLNKIRLLEFIGHLAVALGLDNVYLGHVQVCYLRFELGSCLRLAYRGWHQSSGAIYKDVEETVAMIDDFPFTLAYTSFLQAIERLLQSRNDEFGKEATMICATSSNVLRIIETIKAEMSVPTNHQ